MNEDEDKSLADEYGIELEDEKAEAPQAQAAEATVPGGEVPGAEAAETPAPAEAGGNAFDRMIAQLKAAGFASDDDIEQAMAQKQMEQSVESKLSDIIAELQGQVESGEITPEAADRMYQAERRALELEAKLQTTQAAQAMQQQAQAVAAIQKVSPELAQAIGGLGLAPEQLQALSSAVAAAMDKNGERKVAEYVAAKGQGAETAPIPQGGSAQPGDSIPVDVKSASFGDLFRLSGGLKL